MEYPLLSEYKEAILSAEDNFNELSSLRPVIDSYGNPIMSSGNFAVVFKMKDENDGKFYAVKCFIKDQDGRDESYKKIAEELEWISSSYILRLRYLDNELFVDTDHCTTEEFPVVVMEWVEGETLDTYLNRHINDKYELEVLSYCFNGMAAWLLSQPIAHGDLKPDNILVRSDGSIVLVDYDGMFVPAMEGEKAREIGTPDFRHPTRTVFDFDEHIDDFSLVVIALSLKAIALKPNIKNKTFSSDVLLFTEQDFIDPSKSKILKEIVALSSNTELSLLLSAFFLAYANNTLKLPTSLLFTTNKSNSFGSQPDMTIDQIRTNVSAEDLEDGKTDKFGVVYSKDRLRLLKCTNRELTNYKVRTGTKIICKYAFEWSTALNNLQIPDSVTAIGKGAFRTCNSLMQVSIPESLENIGKDAFPKQCTIIYRNL